jgi:hypothetical protein
MSQGLDDGLKVLRVVIFAMVGMLGVFLGIATPVRPGVADGTSAQFRNMLFLGLGVLVVACASSYLQMERALLARFRGGRIEWGPLGEPPEGFTAAYRQLCIVRAGLAEGPALFSIIVYMLTGSFLALIVAGVAVAVLLGRLPSRSEMQRIVLRLNGL